MNKYHPQGLVFQKLQYHQAIFEGSTSFVASAYKVCSEQHEKEVTSKKDAVFDRLH